MHRKALGWLGWLAGMTAIAAAQQGSVDSESLSPADWSRLPAPVHNRVRAALEVCAREPDNPQAFSTLGKIYHGNFETHLAVRAYEHALKLGARDSQTPYLLGLIYQEWGESEQAERCLKMAIERDGNYAPAHYNLGLTRLEGGDWAAALPPLQRAIELDPKDAAFHTALGRAYRSGGQLEKAEAALRKALDIDPEQAAAAQLLGLTLRALGKAEEAESWLSRKRKGFHILVRDPWLREAQRYAASLHTLLQQARAMLNFGRADNALKLLDQVARVYPDRFEVFQALGDAHRMRNAPIEALQAYDRAMELNPSDPVLPVACGLIKVDLADWNGAAAFVDRALACDPDYLDALALRGYVRFRRGEREAGAKDLRGVLARRADDFLANVWLGELLLESDPAAATAPLEAAVKSAPDAPIGRSRLAEAYWRAGRRDDARREIEAALRLAPRDPNVQALAREIKGGD